MNKLTLKQKNWLLSFHIAVGGIWFGTALVMVAIAWKNQYTENGESLYAIHSVLKLLDDFVIIPSATLSLLSGALLCGLTIWGFIKHYWVIAKWIVTVGLIVFGTLWLGPWTNAMTAMSEVEKLQVLENPIYMFDRVAVIIGGILTTLFLLAIIAISTLKPWGRRKVENRG
ncbi:MAG: hypothetical protein ACRC2R_04350 [Xenococcaceae cyanobacterium]